MWFMTGWDKVGDYGKKESGRSAKESRQYFRFQAEPYEALYKLVTDAYFKVAEVAADEPVQDTEEPA